MALHTRGFSRPSFRPSPRQCSLSSLPVGGLLRVSVVAATPLSSMTSAIFASSFVCVRKCEEHDVVVCFSTCSTLRSTRRTRARQEVDVSVAFAVIVGVTGGGIHLTGSTAENSRWRATRMELILADQRDASAPCYVERCDRTVCSKQRKRAERKHLHNKATSTQCNSSAVAVHVAFGWSFQRDRDAS